VEDDYISMIGWSEAGVAGMMAEELVVGTDTLSGAVEAGGGLGEWVLLILGLCKSAWNAFDPARFNVLAVPAKGQKINVNDIDISRATPPRKLEASKIPLAKPSDDLNSFLSRRRVTKKTQQMQKPKTACKFMNRAW
jgi:hypothetical protein